jgi:hypothetical protein
MIYGIWQINTAASVTGYHLPGIIKSRTDELFLSSNFVYKLAKGLVMG